MASNSKKLKVIRGNRDQKKAERRGKKEAKKIRDLEQNEKVIVIK